jgi:hypothetical protein
MGELFAALDRVIEELVAYFTPPIIKPMNHYLLHLPISPQIDGPPRTGHCYSQTR